MDRTFQVDLRGIVDLLSHHLYASPRVYVRELLQNAVDAITARRAAEPGAPAAVWIEPPELTGDGTLRVHDTGIGLTEAQVHELLATIGRSSKRDELGFARHEFLGQFGIGLLSCFLVADEIRVRHPARRRSRPCAGPGYADGRYRVESAGPDAGRASRAPRSPWCRGAAPSSGSHRPTVTELARLFGSLLPVTVRVGDGGDRPPGRRRGSRAGASPAARREGLIRVRQRDARLHPVRRDRR